MKIKQKIIKSLIRFLQKFETEDENTTVDPVLEAYLEYASLAGVDDIAWSSHDQRFINTISGDIKLVEKKPDLWEFNQLTHPGKHVYFTSEFTGSTNSKAIMDAMATIIKKSDKNSIDLIKRKELPPLQIPLFD